MEKETDYDGDDYDDDNGSSSLNMDQPASFDEPYSGNVSMINIDKKTLKTINRIDTYMYFFASCNYMMITMMIWI